MQHFLVFFTLKVNLQRERRKTSFAFLSLYESHSCREAETREERELHVKKVLSWQSNWGCCCYVAKHIKGAQCNFREKIQTQNL